MARDGFSIFDSDTHVGPDARILARYLSEAEKDRLQEWEKFKSVDRDGRETYTRGNDATAAASAWLNRTKRRPDTWRGSPALSGRASLRRSAMLIPASASRTWTMRGSPST